MRAISLSAPVGDEHSETGELLPDQTTPSPESEASDLEMREAIREVVDAQPPRTATVLRLRYGLDGAGPLSLEEVAGRLGLSRERVRQIERRALWHLRRELPAATGLPGAA